MAGKGSRARPLGISQQEFDNRFDLIFGKKKKTDAEQFDEAVMKDEYYDLDHAPKGTCGCGRSPTGDCCGWHSLTEEQYQAKLVEYKNAKS